MTVPLDDLKRTAAFSEIRERIGKLVPRLASDYPGEVVATFAAIGRTLATAGLDWHDLARRLTEPTVADLIQRAPAPAPPPQPHAPAAPSKPRRQPSPWPTWGTLSHFGRLAMFDTIAAEAALPPAEAARMATVRAAYHRQHDWPSTRDQRLFNAACRGLWAMGWRPAEKAA